MMSSFASVFVAKANATPEKVVPFVTLATAASSRVCIRSTYKVDTDYQLCPTSVRCFYFRWCSLISRMRSTHTWLRVAIAGRVLHWVAWGPGWWWLPVHGLTDVAARLSAGVDGWRSHWAVGAALLKMWTGC